MKLDLSKDKEKIQRYIVKRIKNYPVYVNDGPFEELDIYFAEMLRKLMCELREDGSLAKLPLRKDAYFLI